MNRSERRFQIVRVLAEKARDNENRDFDPASFMTLRQIARACQLRPTLFLRAILADLVEDGIVRVRVGRAENGVTRFEYQLEEFHDLFVKLFDDGE